MVHSSRSRPEAHRPDPPAEVGPVRSILVVDNEPLICEVIEAILSPKFSVHTVWSGTEALQAVATRHFDLVLLDVNLPGLSGERTLAALLGHDPNTRIVMMSGIDHTERALEAGAVGFLLKPYRPGQVLDEVERALGEHVTAL